MCSSSNQYVWLKFAFKASLMEVQGFSCPFSGFCEGLRAFSIFFCSSLAFHWYPRLEGPLLVTLFQVFTGSIGKVGAYMHHCMMTFRRQGTCANFLQVPYTLLLHLESSYFSGFIWIYWFFIAIWIYLLFLALKGGGLYITPFTVWVLHCWTKPRGLTGGVLCRR